MEKQEMINEILAYEQELRFIYEECKNAFGHLDNDTQRAIERWLVIEELLTRLNLNDEK
jgi:hypothetical protein